MTYVVVEGVLAVVVIRTTQHAMSVERKYTTHPTIEEARAVAKVIAAFEGKAYYDYAVTPLEFP